MPMALPSSLPDDLALDVLIIGAGLSGIGAAVHLQRQCPQHRIALLEARASIGGTWDLFRYPGVRSDSDMHTLGYAWKPWSSAQAMADGAAIRAYLQETADAAGITPRIHFAQTVVSAAWSSNEACWTVVARHGPTGQQRTIRARFLYCCAGYYRYDAAHRPAFAGEADFAGTIVVPQFWPARLDYAGRRVVVIGSGATAVTIVPAMATTAAHVTMLQRSPSYVVARPATDAIARVLQACLPAALAHALTRWKNVLTGLAFYQLARRYPQRVKQTLVARVAEALAPGYDVARHFTPHYAPWDQRVCAVPDGDLFEAIRAGRASVVTDTIARFTADGILLASGAHLPADIVVMATGLQLQMMGGVALSVDGQPCAPQTAMMYKGMMLSDVPNCVTTFGYTNASWTLKADLTAGYVCRLLRHMEQRGLAIAVAPRAPDVAPAPYLNFTSGYVTRARHLLPQQGTRGPWRVHQNYLRDLMALRFGRIDDGVLRFGMPGKMPCA